MKKLIVLFLALLMCLVSVVTVMAAPDDVMTVAVETDTNSVVYGDTVKVSVVLSKNPGFLGLNFDVKWDDATLELVTAEKSGTAFDKIETVHQEIKKRVVVTVGDPLLGIVSPDAAKKYEGTGEVLRLTFKVKEGANVDTSARVYIERASYVKVGGGASEEVTAKEQTFHVSTTALTVTGLVLRPTCSGLFFKGVFNFGKEKVARYGIAVSVKNKLPVADDSDPTSLYTVGHSNVLISNILAGGGANGTTRIYARPYMLLENGTYVYGEAVASDLKSVVEQVDSKLESLDEAQKTALADMYRKFSDAMQSWQIPNIKKLA